jgi:hypothetical protein
MHGSAYDLQVSCSFQLNRSLLTSPVVNQFPLRPAQSKNFNGIPQIATRPAFHKHPPISATSLQSAFRPQYCFILSRLSDTDDTRPRHDIKLPSSSRAPPSRCRCALEARLSCCGPQRPHGSSRLPYLSAETPVNSVSSNRTVKPVHSVSLRARTSHNESPPM